MASGATSPVLSFNTRTGAVTLSSTDVLTALGLSSFPVVTQATSKTTGVVFNVKRGTITTASTALAAGATATFTVTNSTVVSNNVVILSLNTGATTGAYRYWIETVATGSFSITIENRSAGSLSEALSFNFAII